jgi:hypothetical protein
MESPSSSSSSASAPARPTQFTYAPPPRGGGRSRGAGAGVAFAPTGAGVAVAPAGTGAREREARAGAAGDDSDDGGDGGGDGDAGGDDDDDDDDEEGMGALVHVMQGEAPAGSAGGAGGAGGAARSGSRAASATDVAGRLEALAAESGFNDVDAMLRSKPLSEAVKITYRKCVELAQKVLYEKLELWAPVELTSNVREWHALWDALASKKVSLEGLRAAIHEHLIERFKASPSGSIGLMESAKNALSWHFHDAGYKLIMDDDRFSTLVKACKFAARKVSLVSETSVVRQILTFSSLRLTSLATPRRRPRPPATGCTPSSFRSWPRSTAAGAPTLAERL